MATVPPLTGIKVLEFAGLAPGPFAGVFFADAGADVLRIDRPVKGRSHTLGADVPDITEDMLARHKSSIAVDLKNKAGVALIKELATHADVLIDPFRPGVLERLGLGPEVLHAANPRLIYARLSGFRRDGKYKDMAGHDINYLAVSGVLSVLGRSGEKPTPPWNILADFAGGGLMLAVGVLLALAARQQTGQGQVVEANMVDGASYLASFPRFALKTPLGDHPRGQNLLDTGCPYYDTYETSDGGFMAIGPIEPQFFQVLVDKLGLGGQQWETRRYDRTQWPALRAALTTAFRSRSRAAWEAVFDGTDACCTPVLGFPEIEAGRTSGAREGDLRPAVALRSTPLLAVTDAAKAAGVSEEVRSRRGQGSGVAGEGYEGQALRPGEGGEDALKRWRGWTKGAEYDVTNGGLVLKGADKARL
ncbi:alpha-methylacyl-CoA racemase [Sporothrix brasiliensis 5110]|uniref:Alpha-methylacyl-CoA racemase n=1 Tax=Sporothrix brasiliensis 5110 TaxID=1398154 RepID=A0A0C2IIX0_9PEZI|nr:alpha-methylacyl-CoA racemase [Sporothrix brasiliensis 5110]KIH86940.1 alpha-methylacyl-CoA racemase [Sporothrix brasiliensis 5110]